MAAALQLLFKYDWDDCLDAYTSDVEAKATTAQVSSLFWAPPQQRHIALLRESDDVLKTYGLEYEAPAKSGHKESGNMARRRLYMNMLLDCAVASSVQAGQIGLAESDTLEWYQFTLRRMSCNHVERVAAYVKDKKCFMKAAGKSTSENNSASDALIHRDVLFIVFVGLAVKQAHGPSMKDLYTSDHPLVPPQCLPLVLWPKFYADMCASPDEEVRESVTSYARQLIRFLIPSYAFALGPIPDPSLWKFDFTVEDVENLYHGECTDPRLKKVTDALTKRQCSGFPDDWKGTNDAHELRRRMWNLAYSIHVLLWGLHSNDRRLLDLLDTNHSLLKELDTRYERRMCGSDTTCILFVLKTRRASMAARECGCAMRPPWLLPTSEATAGDCLKHFFYEHQLLGSVSKLDSEGIEEDIRAEVSNWDDERLFSVLWTHCTDRVRLIDAESHGSHSLKKHWESAKALFPQQQQLAKFRLALTLGSDLATSDPRQGEGYDRIVHILTASIRKLVLDVRLCHENVSRMGTKYWRYSGGEQSVITIPFGCNIIVLREVHPKRLNNCSIVDIGMDLAGLYRVREDDSNMTQVCQLEKIESAPIVDPDRKEDPGETDSYQPLRQFLVETARARGGSFVLHGFCESTVEGVHERKVHEVKITVLNRDGLGNQFEDLSFLVRVDSDDVQEATTITSAVSVGHGAGQRSCAFLRLGIQLNNAALGIKPKHRVHESAQCLAAALDGENMFESDPRQVMSADHRSRAMQMSPLMLKFLPRTNEKLKQFHREHIASQMECLLTLFDPDGVRVLGLAIGELSFAKMVLQDASYTVISVNVDDLSFATHYDAIKNLGTMAALSILHLTITSTLPTANIERLVNLTRKTSIRFLIELNPTTLPFFTDSSISSCPAQVLQSSLTLVAGESSMGKLMTKTSALILDAQDLELLRRLLDESKDTIAWAKTQHDALVLHEVSKRHARSRICIVASGHHSVVMSGDVAGTDLIRDINRDPDQHRHIQRLMWDNADTSIVVSVHSIDIASMFYDSPACLTVVEPVIYRPDLVVEVCDSSDESVASLLGCRRDELKYPPTAEAALVVSLVKGSCKTKRVIPTLQGFIMQTPLCDFLSQWARVSLYLYCVVVERSPVMSDIVLKVTAACNNTFSSTIWGSLRRAAAVPAQSDPSFWATHSASHNGVDDIINSTVKDGLPVSVSLLHDWLALLPAPLAFRQYIVHSLSPLMAFAIDPVTSSQLLKHCTVDNTDGAPLWVQRLAERIAPRSMDVVVSPCMSVVRWVVVAGGKTAHSASGAGADLDDISNLGVMIEMNETCSYEEQLFLQTLVGLDTHSAVVKQHKLREYLTKSPRHGGIPSNVAEVILSSKHFGALFVRLMLSAEEDNALLIGDVQHLLLWMEAADPAPVPMNLISDAGLLRRFTPAALVEVLLAAARADVGRWQRLTTLIDSVNPDREQLREMIKWCDGWAQHPHALHFVRALLTTCMVFPEPGIRFSQFLASIPSEAPTDIVLSAFSAKSSRWPLTPLDRSLSATTFAKWLCGVFLRNVHKKLFPHGDDGIPQPDHFKEACEFAFSTTNAAGHREAIDAILEGDYDTLRKIKWVYAVLWITSPLAPEYIATTDVDIVSLLSQYLVLSGELQLRFLQIVKENFETASALALALIGWVEYVPTTMICALGTIPKMWDGRIHVLPTECYRFLEPTTMPGGNITPPYAVTCVPRPLSEEQHVQLFQGAKQDFSTAASLAEGYTVSTGVNKPILKQNLQYLRAAFNIYKTGTLMIPSHVFIGVKMVLLWFACLGEGISRVIEHYTYSEPTVRDRFLEFLRQGTATLALPKEIPPLIVDVQVLRPVSHLMLLEMSSAEGRVYTREVLTARLPKVDGEDWTFMPAHGGPSDVVKVIKGFAGVSALRYVSQCSKLRPTKIDSIAMLASNMLQPCLALIDARKLELAKEYCQTMSSLVDTDGRGALAIVALSIRRADLMSCVLSSGQVPKSIRDEILYFVNEDKSLPNRTELLQKVNGALVGDASATLPNEVKEPVSLLYVIEQVERQANRSFRIEFPTHCGVKREVLSVNAAVSIFAADDENNSTAGAMSATQVDDDEADDDAIRQYMNVEFARKQISGRSIDVSLILTLDWEGKNDNDKKSERAFYLTVLVQPGAECYLVEDNGNLEISDIVNDRRVLNVFKNHGEAWSFCKSRNGPTSLIGHGFFLYRSKENFGGWRFFIGRSIDKTPASTPTSSDSNRFHIWHIGAYHLALCLHMPPALTRLIHVLCEAIYDEAELATIAAPHDESYTQKISRILSALVLSKDEAHDRARRAARPLLAYTRLLISAAERLRRSECPDWKTNLRDFHNEVDVAPVPPRIGCVHDAEVDVLAKARGQAIPCDPQHGKGGLFTVNKGDPAWFVPSDLHDVDLNDDDIKIINEATSSELLSRLLKANEGSLRLEILECVRKLSSFSDSDFSKCILSETTSNCKKLRHVDKALHPLPIANTWTMLMSWIRESIDNIAKLYATQDGHGQSEAAKFEAAKNEHKATLLTELTSVRKRFHDEVARNRSKVKLGEGISSRVHNEIEQCWVSSERTENHLQASLHVLWRDYDPDGFTVEAGEAVGYVVDALFCYRSPRDEVPIVLPPVAGKRLTFTSVESKGQKIVVENADAIEAQPGTVIVRVSAGNLTNLEVRIVPDPDTNNLVRLESVKDGKMVAPHQGQWSLFKASLITDAQYFVMDVAEGDEAEKAHAQFRALMFRWVVHVIGSPLSLEWKSFFLHHTHVHSRAMAPKTTLLVAYSLAQLCPSRKLRDQLLGALSFAPNRFCKRRDRFFGVTVTPHKLDLQNSEWVSLPDKVGPIFLRAEDARVAEESTLVAEQYRAIIKHFSHLTTHVIIEGMPVVHDHLLKWCCEFTKRYPWRFIVFGQCEVLRNMPENRDRVVDLNETFVDRPRPLEVAFVPALREKYQTAHHPRANLCTARLLDWPTEIRRFIRGEGGYGRVVLLVSPPGAGKTMELRNIEFGLSREDSANNRKTRFVNFDCSGDALVQQALVTLLDNALLGIELGTDPVVLVADEYHMLSCRKKAEFLKWAETKLGDIKVVLIANRDDADDESLNQRLRNVSSGAAPTSIIWRARVGIPKMLEALSTCRMNSPATPRKAVTFFSTIRTLICDDVVSLRMVPDLCTSPYQNESLASSLRTKLQPENGAFISMLLESFDRIYDGLFAESKSHVATKYNETSDPIDLLVFTGMLPAMLLWDPSSANQLSDTVVTFLEFVAQTSAYNVHPAVRLASWISHVVAKVNIELPGSLAPRDVAQSLEILRTVAFVDHPSFFPIIEGCGSKADLDSCRTLVYPHVPTLDGIYRALVRHEAIDWSVVCQQWANDPVTDLNAFLKIANPSIVAPETVFMHVTPQNVMGLLQREVRGRASTALQDLVLAEYPAARLEKEGDLASPYFWSVWMKVTRLTLNNGGATWTTYIEDHIPSPRAPVKDEASVKALRARFIFWVAAHGRVATTFADAEERTKVAASVIAKLANTNLESNDDHARLWRSDFIAPAAFVNILGLSRAFAVCEHSQQGAHPNWPADMSLLARLASRSFLLTVDEANFLLGFVGSLSKTTPLRIIGALLQVVPAGALAPKIQQQLLDLPVAVNGLDLNSDVPDAIIVKNVGSELLRRAQARQTLTHLAPESDVGKILFKFAAAHGAS